MPKQIKIGFGSTIGPKVTTLQPLLDIGTGLPLRNETGQPLYTEEFGSLENFYFSKKSLSTHVNNEQVSPVKTVEQFPETSQVSSSLLGVPRDEKQLGLFSDVSVYGFNNNIWEFYNTGTSYQPIEWATRINKTYGRRFFINPQEIPEEQAIAIKAFPVPWTYPFDINFSKLGYYNKQLYPLYVNFFKLGRLMYDSFMNDYNNEMYEKFAEENFLPPWVATIEDVDGIDNTGPVTVPTVVYNETVRSDLVFQEIEKWTMSWIKMRDGILFLPNGVRVDFPLGENGIPLYDATNTIPGYYSNATNHYGKIESKKAFRYQPGRISGFTFGLRASSDQGSLDNIIEWGAANNTDQYMFQIRGPNFSIVRRSTVPLPDQNILDMGLDPSEQIEVPYQAVEADFDPDTGTEIPFRPLYELVIKKDFFNNDRLDGNGPSGHILDIEKVTMYKIEFSWYGAIGAKFYAYVPTGNGDARWVLMHTLIIENKIGKPCLNDPYFKFRYVMDLNDTSSLIAPQYVYKYGASYYIDGGDEGSSTSFSITSEEADISDLNTRSILGLTPKKSIKNREGDEIRNKKDAVPSSISITTDNPIRLDIIECEGCPGFAHHFAPSLHNAQTAVVDSFTFSADGKYITYTDPGKVFTQDDVNKKFIGDGIYSVYANSISVDGSQAYIKRKINNIPTPNYTFQYTKGVQLSNGTEASVKANTFNLRLTGYDSIAVSTVPLTKPNIDVNFLNPVYRDGGSYADFYIGVTSSTPGILDNELVFDNLPYNPNNTLYAEWTEQKIFINYKGLDTSEFEDRYGTTMQIDPQIAYVGSFEEDGGFCSRLSVRVTEFLLDCEHVVEPDPLNPGTDNYYLLFTDSIFSSLKGLQGGEIGIISAGNAVGSGTFFAADQANTVTINQVQKYKIEVSDGNLTGQSQVIFRVVRIYGRYVNKTKVFSFDLYPLYVVVGMRDNAKINNITIEEYDEINKFTYSPEWLVNNPLNPSIDVKPSGFASDLLAANGYYISGGNSIEGFPSTNFIEADRLSSISADKQLEQPLRPGIIKSTIFVGENETKEIDLKYLFGQDRNLITPGLYNTKATFFTAKALKDAAKTQITVNVKEQ